MLAYGPTLCVKRFQTESIEIDSVRESFIHLGVCIKVPVDRERGISRKEDH